MVLVVAVCYSGHLNNLLIDWLPVFTKCCNWLLPNTFTREVIHVEQTNSDWENITPHHWVPLTSHYHQSQHHETLVHSPTLDWMLSSLQYNKHTDWLIEQCLTSPPTQYRLSGRQFYRSKDPTNSIKVLKKKTLQSKENPDNANNTSFNTAIQ